MTKPIQIFKPGRHVAMNGAALSFSESDLAATAAAYDPAKHEAPLVVGHPKLDAPAYGWVKSLAFAEGLDAEPHQVDAEFAEMVGRGAFKKVSASFYQPDSPSNPVPGVFYLRHVGFLGAQAPAVKGLRAPEFADTEEGVVEFSEAVSFSGYDDMSIAKLFRRLREWMIGKYGVDAAEKVLPDYELTSLELSAQQEIVDARVKVETAAEVAPSFSEPPQPQGDEMSAEEKARLDALEKENAELKAKSASFAEAEAKRKTDAAHADHVAFADKLIGEGRLLPASKDVTVATLDLMAAQAEEPVEFGEGDAKQPLIDAHKAFLSAQPKQVEFSEVSGAGGEGKSTVDFAAPNGMSVDADRLALHQKALAYQSANKTTYDAALAAVSV